MKMCSIFQKGFKISEDNHIALTKNKGVVQTEFVKCINFVFRLNHYF